MLTFVFRCESFAEQNQDVVCFQSLFLSRVMIDWKSSPLHKFTHQRNLINHEKSLVAYNIPDMPFSVIQVAPLSSSRNNKHIILCYTYTHIMLYICYILYYIMGSMSSFENPQLTQKYSNDWDLLPGLPVQNFPCVLLRFILHAIFFSDYAYHGFWLTCTVYNTW